MTNDTAMVFFDGHCNLCNGAVAFILKRDSSGYFKFASLETGVAVRQLEEFGIRTAAVDSIVLVEEGQVYVRSAAALRIAKKLNGLWPLLYVFIIIPRPLRDAIYNWIARNRYRWFGRRIDCMLPDDIYKDRFAR